ncbi:hypothetical protein BC374_03585 [Ensifer sp. LC13]|nr:hypothetical protein BC374_03585 [Ensifer sp. LC13]
MALSTFAIAALLSGTAMAEDTLRTIKFLAGHTSVAIHDDLVERDSHIFVFAAEAGQEANIQVKSLEENADLTIYQPPSKIEHDADGLDVDGEILQGGKPVPGLDPGATRHWQGKLPASGSYYIELVSDRGNVTYDLTVSIK